MPSPIGIRVPFPGSSCWTCKYRDSDYTCKSKDYIRVKYRGKEVGEKRYIDGRTGEVVQTYIGFCCNFFDWKK